MVILVELEIGGVVYASAKVEQSKLNEIICFYRQIGTVRSEGASWEVFVYRKSYKYVKPLKGLIKRDWDKYVLKNH